MTSEEIQAIIPHRYPFLMVDRILECEPGKRAVGIKCVSRGEPFFQGHFPSYPVMPGVLIIEALAQTGAVCILAKEENRGKIPFFAGIDGARFRQKVRPGDVLRLEVEIDKARGPVGRGLAKAYVETVLVAEATLLFYLDSPE